jgi:diacylglycerol O-acyltransferase / wax synthase
MDRMSPLDASFLHIEDDVNHMHIGSTAIFEGPVPAFADLESMIAGRIPLVPRYRQRVRFVPLAIGRPVWVDDPTFRLGYHLRHTALPAPGGREELRALVGRVMAQPLDRTKPLWELWVVEGLEDGHWALVSKIHHAIVDGIAGTDLLAVILDVTPEPRPPTQDDWRPEPPPSDLRLVADAAAGLLRPYEQWRAIRSVTRAPRRVARRAVGFGRGMASMAGMVRHLPATSLTGPIGPHRRYAWASATLDDIRTVRRAFGGTVNDVVLAAITRGFRDLLLAHGEPPEQRVIRSLVPVSVRQPEERGRQDNRVSAMFAELPVGVEDPVERLVAIRDQMDHLKQSDQAVAAETITSMGGFAPPMLLALGMRVATRALRGGGYGISTVTTNVPGPQIPLYALGRRMIEACPYVPIAAPARVGVAIFSYVGRFTFGVTADFDTVPDIDVITDGIEAGTAELVKAAERANPGSAR